MQYTIRGIPDTLNVELRERARREGKSLNEVVLEVLAEGVGLGERPPRRRDLGDVARTWKKDPRIEEALAAQDVVDEDLWK